MGEKKLAHTLEIPVPEAVAFMKKYMATYPAVDRYFNETQNTLEQYGCVYTLLGRVRSLPEIASPNPFHRWRAGRQAGNFQIQGSAAECAKLAMIELYERGFTEETGWIINSQIHDEIITEGPEETSAEASRLLQTCMEDPFRRFGLRLKVQLKAQPTVADTWQDAK